MLGGGGGGGGDFCVEVGHCPYVPYGGALELMYAREPEVLLCGPAGTGKTVACLNKLYLLAHKYPGVRCLICRKTRESLTESALVAWERDVVPVGHPMLLGPQRRLRQVYVVGNGSEVVVCGLDKSQKVMSTQFDLIYLMEAIECTEEDWENLTTRLRHNRMPYQQLLADTNPAGPGHWLKRRCDVGRVRLIESRHEDNPRLFVPGTGEMTEYGRAYMSKLDSLTGVRRLRLRYGRWVQAEGVVYEGWDDRVHVVDRFELSPWWRRVVGIDWGYNDPCSVGFWVVDGDGRLYLYKEVYKTRMVLDELADLLRREMVRDLEDAVSYVRREYEGGGGFGGMSLEECLGELSGGLRYEFVADHAMGERRVLEKYLGVQIKPACKSLSVGLNAVAERLRVQGDGRPRLMVFRDTLVHERDSFLVSARRPTCLLDEVEGYVWREGRDCPVDENNHAMDMMRYVVMHVSGYEPFYATVVEVV